MRVNAAPSLAGVHCLGLYRFGRIFFSVLVVGWDQLWGILENGIVVCSRLQRMKPVLMLYMSMTFLHNKQTQFLALDKHRYSIYTA